MTDIFISSRNHDSRLGGIGESLAHRWAGSTKDFRRCDVPSQGETACVVACRFGWHRLVIACERVGGSVEHQLQRQTFAMTGHTTLDGVEQVLGEVRLRIYGRLLLEP